MIRSLLHGARITDAESRGAASQAGCRQRPRGGAMQALSTVGRVAGVDGATVLGWRANRLSFRLFGLEPLSLSSLCPRKGIGCRWWRLQVELPAQRPLGGRPPEELAAGAASLPPTAL